MVNALHEFSECVRAQWGGRPFDFITFCVFHFPQNQKGRKA